ncbi:type II secretion system minor pseudopilin GspJ [Vagococcus sp. WN89Y]|uniref:type II secretion system minor pseudopilin GspJ n=1 Tax=Vagococcus sp. WN89Y TaxID=3457258 RepID=UPI003FCEA7B9
MAANRHGFTLLEMLVAIAIFALFALLGQQVTDGMLRADALSAGHEQKLRIARRTMQLLGHDVTQMVPRAVRSAEGIEPALQVQQNDTETVSFRFIRAGVPNPQMALAQSHLMKVGYRIRQGFLERLSWPQPEASPVVQRLMPARRITLQYYDGSLWMSYWQAQQAIPQAIKMQLVTADFGVIERIWLLRGPHGE